MSEENKVESVESTVSCIGCLVIIFIVFVTIVLWNITPELIGWLEWKLSQR